MLATASFLAMDERARIGRNADRQVLAPVVRRRRKDNLFTGFDMDSLAGSDVKLSVGVLDAEQGLENDGILVESLTHSVP